MFLRASFSRTSISLGSRTDGVRLGGYEQREALQLGRRFQLAFALVIRPHLAEIDGSPFRRHRPHDVGQELGPEWRRKREPADLCLHRRDRCLGFHPGLTGCAGYEARTLEVHRRPATSHLVSDRLDGPTGHIGSGRHSRCLGQSRNTHERAESNEGSVFFSNVVIGLSQKTCATPATAGTGQWPCPLEAPLPPMNLPPWFTSALVVRGKFRVSGKFQLRADP